MHRCGERNKQRKFRSLVPELVVLAVALLASPTMPASTITSDVSLVSPGQGSSAVYRYTYALSGLTFLNTPSSGDYSLDIQFNPAWYGQLSDPQAGPDFTVLVFQPNNPPGAQGDYILLANVNQPSLAGTFSVDFTWTGSGSPADSTLPAQPFYIDSFDSAGNCISCPLEGPFETTPISPSAVPEPETVTLVLPGVLICGALWIARRRVSKKVG